MSYLSNRVGEECSVALGILIYGAHRIPLRGYCNLTELLRAIIVMHSQIFSLFSIRFLFIKRHIKKTNQPLGMLQHLLQIMVGTALIYTTYTYNSGHFMGGGSGGGGCSPLPQFLQNFCKITSSLRRLCIWD